VRSIQRTNWFSHEPCRRSADLDWSAGVGGEPVEQVAQAVGELLLGAVLSQPDSEPRDQRVLRLVDADRSEVPSDVCRRAPDGGTGQRANWLPSASMPGCRNWRRRP